jgi:hypothetical protein
MNKPIVVQASAIPALEAAKSFDGTIRVVVAAVPATIGVVLISRGRKGGRS